MRQTRGDRVILELGTGAEPDSRATHTLDIREDVAVDFPGVDIGVDPLPFDDGEVDGVLGNHVLEHVPPERIGFVFREIDRVLVPGGFGAFESPHAGTWAAATDPTHQGVGGFTTDVEMYFDGSGPGYWPDLDWRVEAHAELEFPTLVRPSARVTFTAHNHSSELVKIPFVNGVVQIRLEKLEEA